MIQSDDKKNIDYITDNEVNLNQIIKIIWNNKLIISISSVMIALIAAVVSLSIPNQYTATALLAPASNSDASSLSRLAGQFGGLASLAGINLGENVLDDKSSIAIQLLKTWNFQEEFIIEQSIAVQVFAAYGWDRIRNELIIDEDIYDTTSNLWVRDYDSSKGETAEPNSWELYEELNNRVTISQDNDSGVVSLSVQYYSPYVASIWVGELVSKLNEHFQNADKLEAKNTIEYLRNMINKTQNTEMKSVFYQLIEEQTKKLMLTEVSDEYVFKYITPAKVPFEKSSPNRALITVVSFIIGAVLITALILLFNITKIRR